jgi:serine/threonine protein kinase/TolB-like protein
MEAERWKQIDDLLQSALEKPIDQQEAYVRQECGDDPSLLGEVLSLLSAHREAGTFLNPPALDPSNMATQADNPPTSASNFTSMAGRTVSHYRVLRRLGSGGMGVVYLAEDIKLGRQVALKFLPGELASDPAAFERLKREARSASVLDHSNICPIYELGEDEGQPFIVMQLLDGQTLREWIDHSSKQDGRARLEPAMDFAIQVAQGLDAAHQKGIIHRDIKPANIFVTRRNEAKILDFGLAKAVEDHTGSGSATTRAAIPATAAEAGDPHLTRTGVLVGTAYYMSPEQVRGEKLDTRTDLFSLGLVLYEMVTGRRPFAGETSPAIYESILTRQPIQARQLNPAVPAELERIIGKALEKERARRYRTAQEMAKDLSNLRERLPEADSWWDWKKVLLAATLAMLVAGAGIWYRAKHRTLATTGETATTTPAAKARRAIAVLGFRNLSNQADQEWLATALAEMVSTELAAGQQLRIIPGENVARMKLDLSLAGAGGYGADTLQKIRQSLGTDVIAQGSYLVSAGKGLRIDLKLQEANGGDTIASVSENGTEAQIADLVSRAGASLREQLGIAAVSSGELDQARTALPRDPQAARLYAEALAKMRAFDAQAARDLVTRAIAVEPDHAMSHSLLADALAALGYDAQAVAEAKKAFDLSHGLPRENQLLVEGRYHELSNDLQAAIDVYNTLCRFFPDDLEYGLKLVSAQLKAALGKNAMATVARLRQLPEPSRSDPRIDLAEANVSESQSDFKRSQQMASTAAEKAKAQGRRLLEGQARDREAWAWDRLGEMDKSIAAYQEARELAESGGNLRAAGSAINGVGNVLYDKGDFVGARKAYEEVLAIARKIGSVRMISVGENDLGNVYYDQGYLEEARKHYQAFYDIDREIGDKRGVAGALGSLANVEQSMGNLVTATRMQEESLQAFRDVGDRRGESSVLNNLSNILFAQGQVAAARQRLDESMAVLEKIGYKRGRGFALHGLASILEAEDKLPEARARAEEAIALRKELGDESTAAASRVQLGDIALAQGKPEETESLARGAAEVFVKQNAADDVCAANSLLARALAAQGRANDAQHAMETSQCGKGQDHEAKIIAELAAGTVKWKSGATAEALKILEGVRADAAKRNYVVYELVGRLLIGQAQLTSGKASAGRAELQSLEKDAAAKGFALVARQAKDAMEGKFSY